MDKREEEGNALNNLRCVRSAQQPQIAAGLMDHLRRTR